MPLCSSIFATKKPAAILHTWACGCANKNCQGKGKLVYAACGGGSGGNLVEHGSDTLTKKGMVYGYFLAFDEVTIAHNF